VSDVEAIVRQVERDAAEVLVLGVHAAAFEVSGSAGAAVVDEVNAALAARHGERFVDVQAALLAAVPTGDGVAAAELRVDDVHLSARGDAVVAQAVGARLRAVGRWPVAGA
jgi:lysophospholipase L1-like esterase